MFEMFGRKSVSRKPEINAITSNKRRKSRHVSAKDLRGEQAPTKATTQKRRGLKHGGRKRTSKLKKKDPVKQSHGVPETETKYHEITKKVIAEIKENNLKTVPEVAAVIKDNFLEGKPYKEKAATLDGLVRYLGKHPGKLTTYSIILLMGIYYLFRSLGLEVYITSAAKSVWDYVFSETTTSADQTTPFHSAASRASTTHFNQVTNNNWKPLQLPLILETTVSGDSADSGTAVGTTSPIGPAIKTSETPPDIKSETNETPPDVRSTSTNRTASGSVVDPDTNVHSKLYDEVDSLTAKKKYPELAELVESNYLAANYLIDKSFGADRDVASRNAFPAMRHLRVYYPKAGKILKKAETQYSIDLPSRLSRKKKTFHIG